METTSTANIAAPQTGNPAGLEDIDLYDPDRYVIGVPHEQLARLRARAPVYFHPDPQTDGFWAVTRHEDVVFISRNAEIFSSGARTAMLAESDGDALEKQKLLFLNMDAPEHTRLRGLVNRGFTPRMVARLHQKVEGICGQLVDKALAAGELDVVTGISAPLPLQVIAELMGIPEDDHQKVFHWSNQMIGFDDPEFGTSENHAQMAAAEVFLYANELGAQKRACPVDDIVSKLISPDDEGNQLTEMEFDMFFILLAVAGNETTRNAISGGVLALIENPDEWQRLKDDPELCKTAVDEIVRWVSPVMQFRRTVMEDVELGGKQLKAGDKVVMFYPSANRDETVFDDPYRFDVARDPNPHLGFGGGGPHFCLGSHLAKQEIELLLRALVSKVDRIDLLSDPRRLRSNFINGIKEMRVRLVPAS